MNSKIEMVKYILKCIEKFFVCYCCCSGVWATPDDPLC